MTGPRPRSLRVRIVAGALVVVIAGLCTAGFVLVHRVEHEMLAEIDATLRANADFVARTIRAGDQLPMGEGPTDLYVQFIGPEGQVVGASSSAERLSPLARVTPDAPDTIVSVERPSLGDLRVLTMRLDRGSPLTLVVARSAASVTEVSESLVQLLIAMVVVGIALLGTLIWFAVGRALRPVEEMRSTVDTMREESLHRRVEAPGTGDELDRLADTLNQLLERLDRAVTRERQFVADASHELRTPLAAVRALLETEPSDPGAVVAGRAEALARLDQLQDLVEELLVLARHDEEVGAPSMGPVDLDELVLSQARQLERTTNLRIDVSEVSGGQVSGHDTDLARVVENLASNAARHARTTVRFAVRQDDGCVELTVNDDGPGIAPADRARIFERFTVLEDERATQRGGSGLGLSIASAIVDAHHGSIHAHGLSESGATFVVHLPAHGQTATPDIVSPSTVG